MTALRARAGRALLVALLGLAAAGPARASVEEFASFDVAGMEEDDENFLDHFEVRFVDDWRDDWERSAGGFRTSEGCFTAGIWSNQHDFKARAPLGDHSFLDLAYLERDDMQATWQWLDLDFKRATSGAGTFGVRFRPTYDKSQQDFAALWEWGDGGSPTQVQAAFTVEDAFNSLWEFRQTRVGNHAEPYRIHPYEPALRVVSRGAHHRLELSGTWLTPSRKAILDPNPALDASTSLWGSKGGAVARADAGAWSFETRGDAEQAASSQERAALPGNARVFRRQWEIEAAIGRSLSAHWRAEARLFYQDRAQSWAPPVADARFHGVDRMQLAELDWLARRDWTVRLGLLHNRIGIATRGAFPDFTWGSRKEARAFIGLRARFGHVVVQGLEGIELDAEPYPVSFHHDKGFLQMQTTF